MKKIILVMAVTVALSLNACTFTDRSETSNMVDESVSVDQGGQVIRVDIPNGDGTFTTLGHYYFFIIHLFIQFFNTNHFRLMIIFF